jgi:putative transposase
LEQRILAWRHGRHSVGFAAQCAELPGLKVAVPWLAEAPSHCLQQTLRDLDQAFQNYFAGRAAFPAFRKKGQRDAFRFPDPKQFIVSLPVLPGSPNFKGAPSGRLKLPKLGWVACRNGKGRHGLQLMGKPKFVTVSREGKRWFASVLCEGEIPETLPVQGAPVGVDLGVAQAIALSTGEVLAVLGRTPAEDRRLARLQRTLARRRKGSKNRAKAQKRLGEFHVRIARRRRDSIHKATTKLAKNHSLIVIEDLRVRAMTASAKGTLEAPGRNVKAKSGLNRALLNVGFAEIRRQLEYKCPWYGSKLMARNPAYSSQQCSDCGHTDPGNRPSQAVFRCLACGHFDNADVNAAKNILARGTAEGPSVAVCGAMPSGGRRNRNLSA